MYKIILTLFIIFSTLLTLSTSIISTTCGAFTPGMWFNLGTNDQITIEFGAISFNSDYNIPYLFGCLPKMASSPTQNISFLYNAAGLVTSSKSLTSQIILSYVQPIKNGDYYFFSGTWITNLALSLNTLTDSDQRIVTIETSAFKKRTIPQKRELMTRDLLSGVMKRSILAPLGDRNYYYQGPYENLASQLNVAWNGIEQATYQYNYLNDVVNSRIVGMNVTTALFEDTPYYLNYDYHYNSAGQLDYYCVNTCNSAMVLFGYDSMGRLVNATAGQEILLTIQYDVKGNAVQVQSSGTV